MGLPLLQKQKNEALYRMNLMGLDVRLVREYFLNGTVYVSGIDPLASASELPLLHDCQFRDLIKKFEKDYKATVYYCVFSYTIIGDMVSCFYVSEHESEWDEDRRIILEGTTFAYVENLSDPMCSEIGLIAFKMKNGLAIRTS